ncbi:MAG: anhydro-N-acetylmuramic acid kinase [Planctomycetota bacterium]
MDQPPPRVRHVIGCMTGTSLDGLDAALTRITGTGLDMTAEFVGMVSAPLPDALRTTLLSMANGEPYPPIEYMRAARYLGVVHAEACAELISTHGQAAENSGGGGIDFVVAHGQTIWHAPADRLSWQLFDPWPIVRTLNLPVCYDLRQADLVADGEGAPITPIADWVMYRKYGLGVVVLNLGGIANVTKLTGDVMDTEGRDVYPCNLLIDGVVQQLFPGKKFDNDGQVSAQGISSDYVHNLLMKHPKIIAADEGFENWSLGREDVGPEWIKKIVDQAPQGLRAADIVASTVDAVGRWLGLEMDSAHLNILAGGGTKNPILVDKLKASASSRSRPKPVKTVLSDELGIPCEAREAMGFAVLGALSADGVPITLPRVTGSEKPGVTGVWAYPEGPPC